MIYEPKYNTSIKKQNFVNVENHVYSQKLFRYELRLQETLGTISRSGGGAMCPPPTLICNSYDPPFLGLNNLYCVKYQARKWIKRHLDRFN